MRTLTINWLAWAIMFVCLGLAQKTDADEALTARNKALVRDFYTTVLIDRHIDAAPQFLRADYIQHNPNVPTGLKGFMDTFRERFAQKLPADYKRELLNVVGENDTVVIYVRQTWTGRDGSTIRHLALTCFESRTAKLPNIGMPTNPLKP